MAVYHGKSGKVNFSTDLFDVLLWTLTTVSDTAEATAMGDTWQTFEQGLTDFTASADGNAETTVDYTSTIGTEATLKLYIDDTHYFSANAICTAITETASIDDIGKITYAFEGDDASGITYS